MSDVGQPTVSDDRFTQLVVIGSSAGGVEALSTLVGTLPTDFPAPIILAQHLDPTRISHLGEILAARSTLPVRVVAGAEPLHPGTVFVVPANRHIEVTDHAVTLHEEGGGRSKPSVDMLLSTAAAIFGEGLIAVVLTGMGSDGADGAREVKIAGGTVIIQNPDTASFPSMPLSLAPTSVDIVANLETIGPLLHDLLTGVYEVPRAGEDRQFTTFLEQLRERSGIDFGAYKPPTILRRLRHRMAATGTDDLNAYVRHIQRHPDEYQRLISSFLINVTEFFRDPELFAHLRDEVLPSLLDQAKGRGELRIWSAGCATGEEAYSLAILVLELLGDDAEELTVRIFATDIDNEAIAYARRGVYPKASLRAIPPDYVDRYFTPLNGAYEINKRVRSLVVFGQHDLGQRAPFPRIDLALCRNVLIYFTPDLQKRTLQLFAFSLRDGGNLVLGKAETVSQLPEAFALEQPRLKVYRRVGDRILIPPTRHRGALAVAPMGIPAPRSGSITDLAVAHGRRDATPRSRPIGDQVEGLLMRLPIGIVVVDNTYDVRLINGAARHLLGIHSPAVGEDFLHLLHADLLSTVRRAIDDAFSRGSSGPDAAAAVTADAIDTVTGITRAIDVRCYPERLDGGEGPADVVVVQVTDASERERHRGELAAETERRDAAARDQTVRIDRLSATNRDLLLANRELTVANAELRSANEDLLVSNEEVQAASEEVETLNEELQATNEELETLNEELQATVEELNTTNDDLQARSVEIQDAVISLEAQRRESETERARLTAVLSGMSDAVLVVDAQGRHLLTNGAYDRLAAETGPPPLEDRSGEDAVDGAPPRVRASNGEAFRVDLAVPSPDGPRWFEVVGAPVTSEGTAGAGATGGVVVFRDITDRSVRQLQERFVAMASHELRTPLTALQTALQLVQRRLGADDRAGAVGRHVDLSLSQVQRLRAYVDDLMDVARLRTGKLTLNRRPLQFAPLVDRVARTAQMLGPGQVVQAEVAEELWVDGDPGRLEQAVLNLLSNAVTHAPESDRIDVRLRRGAPERDGTSGYAELEVRDFGPGISAGELSRIFSQFAQLEHSGRGGGGLGLGLYIAREIVDGHGGEIVVESTVGEGSRFTIRLPLLAADRIPSAGSAEGDPSASKRGE